MNRELRKLYKQTLKEKWLPLLKEWNKKQEISSLYSIRNKCAFCYEAGMCSMCSVCKINHKICDDFGKQGYYRNRKFMDSDPKSYLKEMIRLLKIEKFKCLFKRNKKK